MNSTPPEPCFSVIIPAYNVEKYISHTVASVLGQSFSDFELIVVEHGSSDETKKRLLEIRDRRLTIIDLPRTPENATVAHPRNLGIQSARGRFLAFLDSDDLWESEKLTRCHDKLQQGAVFVFSNASIIDHDGRFLRTRRLPDKIEGYGLDRASLLLLLSNPIQTSGVVIEKRFLGLHRFDERKDLFTSEDALLWAQLNQKRGFDYIAEPLVRYRIHDANSSRPYDEGRARERFAAVRSAMIESGCISEEHVDFVRRVDELQFQMLKGRRRAAIIGLTRLAALSTPRQRRACLSLVSYMSKLAALRLSSKWSRPG